MGRRTSLSPGSWATRSLMLGLNGGELTLFALLVFAVVSARFWPAAGARLAERFSGLGPKAEGSGQIPKTERTNDAKAT